MTLAFRVSAAAPATTRTDLLAVPAFAGRALGPGAAAVDDSLGGGLAAFLAEAGFEGKVGEAVLVPVGDDLAARSALVIGLGEQSFRTFKVRRDPRCPACGEDAGEIVIAEYDQHCLPHAVLADGSTLSR